MKMMSQPHTSLNVVPVNSGRKGWKLVEQSLCSYFDMYWYKQIFNDINNSKRNGGNKIQTFRFNI